MTDRDKADSVVEALDPSIVVHITPNERGNPPTAVADAELHFMQGPLAGMKLIGFRIWKRPRGGGEELQVTFPARQYSVNGERRSFALLRPTKDAGERERVRDFIITAYEQWKRAHV
jgi:hypothetical protein